MRVGRPVSIMRLSVVAFAYWTFRSPSCAKIHSEVKVRLPFDTELSGAVDKAESAQTPGTVLASQ
jgi:hypothetical protein